MKIVIGPGSLRAESWNRKLARRAAELMPEHVSPELWYELDSLPFFNQDHEASPADAVVRAREVLADADAVLVVTPEYNAGTSGVLKNAIDWWSRALW